MTLREQSSQRSTRHCEKCGSNLYTIVNPSLGYYRKECADSGSTGPFVAREALAGDTE